MNANQQTRPEGGREGQNPQPDPRRDQEPGADEEEE